VLRVEATTGHATASITPVACSHVMTAITEEAETLIAGLVFAAQVEAQAEPCTCRAKRNPPQLGGLLTSQPC